MVLKQAEIWLGINRQGGSICCYCANALEECTVTLHASLLPACVGVISPLWLSVFDFFSRHGHFSKQYSICFWEVPIWCLITSVLVDEWVRQQVQFAAICRVLYVFVCSHKPTSEFTCNSWAFRMREMLSFLMLQRACFFMPDYRYTFYSYTFSLLIPILVRCAPVILFQPTLKKWSIKCNWFKCIHSFHRNEICQHRDCQNNSGLTLY